MPAETKRAFMQGGVSCVSSTMCEAIGDVESTSNQLSPLAESWNGTKWALQEFPVPTGAQLTAPKSVSCVSSTMCIAAGMFSDSSSKSHPFAESWNGTTWSAQELSAPKEARAAGLEGISCTSSTACMAVGEFISGSGSGGWVPLAESWNGTEWSVQEPPIPSNASWGTILYGVSCTSSTACTATSYIRTNSSKVGIPLAESWNGTKWAVEEAPAPAGATYVFLYGGVSCTSGTACMAVGQFGNSAGETVPLAERHE
jgi:hypothetical protein